MMEAAMIDEAVFDSANDAIRFAFNFRSTSYGRNALAAWIHNKDQEDQKVKRKAPPGLVGLDGAGQAGMVLAEVDRLDKAKRAVLTVRYAPRNGVCPSCGGRALAQPWREALKELIMYVVPFLPTVSHLHMRRGLIERHFGLPVMMGALAKTHNVHVNTVGNHYKLVHASLSALEERAMIELEAALQEKGMVAIA